MKLLKNLLKPTIVLAIAIGSEENTVVIDKNIGKPKQVLLSPGIKLF